MDVNSASNSALFDPHLYKLVEKIIFTVILALFANFEAERAQNGQKKTKNLFFKCESE